MPLEVRVNLKNGSNFLYYIPIVMMRGNKSFIEYDNKVIILKDWQWVNSNYNFSIDHNTSEIKSINIDPAFSMADINRENNTFYELKDFN